jgi:hypothetical protein
MKKLPGNPVLLTHVTNKKTHSFASSREASDWLGISKQDFSKHKVMGTLVLKLWRISNDDGGRGGGAGGRRNSAARAAMQAEGYNFAGYSWWKQGRTNTHIQPTTHVEGHPPHGTTSSPTTKTRNRQAQTSRKKRRLEGSSGKHRTAAERSNDANASKSSSSSALEASVTSRQRSKAAVVVKPRPKPRPKPNREPPRPRARVSGPSSQLPSLLDTVPNR